MEKMYNIDWLKTTKRNRETKIHVATYAISQTEMIANICQYGAWHKPADCYYHEENIMAMVGVVSGSLYRQTHSLSRMAWFWVGGRLAPFYIRQMNRVNSRNGSAMMTAP